MAFNCQREGGREFNFAFSEVKEAFHECHESISYLHVYHIHLPFNIFFFLNSRLIYKLYVWAVKTITVLLQYHVMVQYLGIVCSMVYLVITLQLKGDKDRLVIFTS